MVTEKIDAVIVDKMQSNIAEKMQTEFNKFEEKVYLKFVHLRGELLQVDYKLNMLQLQLTDKMTTELDKFQADIDKKFVYFTEELTAFKSTVTEQLDAKFKLVDANFNTLETNISSRVDFFEKSCKCQDGLHWWQNQHLEWWSGSYTWSSYQIRWKVSSVGNGSWY